MSDVPFAPPVSFQDKKYEPTSFTLIHEVEPEEAGLRLDHFLKLQYKRRSREQIQQVIEEGAIKIVRKAQVGKLRPNSKVLLGDEVHVTSIKKPEPPVNFDYKILYEDDVLLVIDKPSNLPVHPAGRYFFNTLLTHLRTNGHKTPMKANEDYYLVHRIDKETSGVLLMAKKSEICAHLTEQFASRTTQKKYLAIVKGLTPLEFKNDRPLKRALHSKVELKMSAVDHETPEALTASTTFRRLETHSKAGGGYSDGDYSLIECLPHTGRQHQIRVHLDDLGHAIVGDKLYGIDENLASTFFERSYISAELEAKLILPRHALHAYWLSVEHPITGKRIEFKSELPDDLRGFLGER